MEFLKKIICSLILIFLNKIYQKYKFVVFHFDIFGFELAKKIFYIIFNLFFPMKFGFQVLSVITRIQFFEESLQAIDNCEDIQQ